MIPKQAIEKAIEGGWGRMKTADPKRREGLIREALKIQERLSLDPTFWQALGKALGWKEFENSNRASEWFTYAHDFYDLILTGGDVTSFWDELLK